MVHTVVTNVTITGFPTVTLSAPTDVCENELFAVSASLSPPPGGTINWAWDFGDGTPPVSGGTGTSSMISRTYSNQGTFPISATAIYSGGSCSGTSTASRLINVKPAPVVNITTTNELCPPLYPTTTLVASVQGMGTYNYDWTGPGSSMHSGTYWTTSTAGTYTLVVTDQANGCTSTETINVATCPPRPTCSEVSFTYTQNCNIFTFNSSFSTGYSLLSWSFGDGTVNTTDPNPSHTYNASGYYFVALTGTDGTDTCTYVERVTVLFIPDFVAEYTCPGNAISVQLLDQTDYLDYAVNPALFTYLWTYPGGTHSGLTPPPITTMSPGPNSVTLDVTYLGTTCSVTKTIDVPEPIDAFFTANDPACEGTPITFTNASAPAVANISSATWDFGDGSGSNLIDAERTYTHTISGSNPLVTLAVTDVYGCVDTYSDNVTVYENLLTGNVTVNPAGPACSCSSVTLSANIPGGTLTPSYLWESNDGIIPLGTSATSAPVPATGEYVVEVTDGNGCKERSPAETVIVIPEPFAFIVGQDEYCVDDFLLLSANQGPDYTYFWEYDINGAGPFTYSGPVISLSTWFTPGTYTFQVMLTDNVTGCSDTSSLFVVTVHDKPQGLTINSSGPPNCAPANLNATVSSPASVNYVWSTGDTGPSTTALGSGTVQVTAFTPQGCQDRETIDIGEGPDLSDVAVGCYCFPDPVYWTAPEGAGYTYAWYMVSSPSNVYLGGSLQQLISTSGEYCVIVTSPDGCSAKSDPILIDIGDHCDECKFDVQLLDLECIGRDEITGGNIYSFTADFTNYGINLAGLAGTSPQAIIGGLSPTVLPGGGTTTTVTGTITLYTGSNAAKITFTATGTNGVSCEFELIIDQFPPCDHGPCDVIWYEPHIECAYTQGGYTYYNFTTSATNFGSTLYNLTWAPALVQM